jgi:DNA repair protein RecO (recombination protein O)
MGIVETEAIILRTYRLAEADKIAVCLTREAGMIRGVARGARRLKSKFGASLEPFTLVTLSYFEKEGRELVTVRHAEIQRSYFKLAVNTEAVTALEYLGQLAIEFAPPHQPDEKLFRMVRACVDAAAQSPENLAAITLYYELWLLKLAGFLPDLRICGTCYRAINPTEAAQYINLEGVLHCNDCRKESDYSLPRETYTHMRTMHSQGPSQWANACMALPVKSRQELSQLSRRLIQRALEREPRGGQAREGITLR